jgi:hypothetical protein
MSGFAKPISAVPDISLQFNFRSSFSLASMWCFSVATRRSGQWRALGSSDQLQFKNGVCRGFKSHGLLWRDVTWRDVVGHQLFGRPCCLHLQEDGGSTFFQRTWFFYDALLVSHGTGRASAAASHTAQWKSSDSLCSRKPCRIQRFTLTWRRRVIEGVYVTSPPEALLPGGIPIQTNGSPRRATFCGATHTRTREPLEKEVLDTK